MKLFKNKLLLFFACLCVGCALFAFASCTIIVQPNNYSSGSSSSSSSESKEKDDDKDEKESSKKNFSSKNDNSCKEYSSSDEESSSENDNSVSVDSSPKKESSLETESSSKHDSSSVHDSSSSSDSGKDDEDDEDDKEEKELLDSEYISTQIIADWVVHSDLSTQSSVVSENSTSAVRGAFNNKGADCYTGEGGNWVWTAVCFDLKAFYGQNINLKDQKLTFDVKAQNCSPTSSIAVVNSKGERAAEKPFDNQTDNIEVNAGFSKEILDSDWVRITVSFDTLFDDKYITEAQTLIIIFSNAFSDESKDSVFYLDNVTINALIDADQDEFTNPEYMSTQLIADWMVHSNLTAQSSVSSQNSTSSIRGAFYNKGVNGYTGEGGNWVWTAVCFDLKAFYGQSKNLNDQMLIFDVKAQNCSPISSLALVNSNGERATEIPFNNQSNNTESRTGLLKEILDSGWVRITVYLDVLFEEKYTSQADTLIIIFSNAFSDESTDSVFYLDNLVIKTAPKNMWHTENYNPSGYYSKTESLEIEVVGNSFIYYSDTAAWLQTIAELNGANLTAHFTWTPNGRIPDQYNNAFGAGGYMTGTYRPDLIYIQDFYDFNDAMYLNQFLAKLKTVSPETEMKIYPGENESEDGITASSETGLDLVNWRALIKDLKTQGFDSKNLNDTNDGWHPNELSGIAGALLIYMDLYGEVPDFTSLWNKIYSSYDWYDTCVADYLPGNSVTEKQSYLSTIFKTAAKYTGLEFSGI